jgi:hypothetical protein
LNQLAVQIVRFVDDAQPGIVACEFEDPDGRRHTLIDKVPIFTDTMLDANSIYPQTGSVALAARYCRWKDSRARELVRVSTVKPDGTESTEGLSEFVMLSSRVSPA